MFRALSRTALLAFLCASGVAQPQVTARVDVAGAVAHRLSVSVEDLKQLPIKKMDERRSVGEGNAREERVRH